jgi:hypothetical protein
LVARRQQFHRGLTLLALLGVILSVGLVTNASFFSQAVDRVILEQNLAEFSRVTGRPPFSTNVYVFPSQSNPLALQDAENISAQIGNALASEVGLPLRHIGLQVSSGTMLLQPMPGSDLYGEGRELLGSVSIIYIADVASHMADRDIVALKNAEVLTGPDAKAFNSFEQPDLISPSSLSEHRLMNGRAELELPSLSFAAITFQLT